MRAHYRVKGMIKYMFVENNLKRDNHEFEQPLT